MVWLFIILIIVVGLVVHFAVDAPNIQQQKDALEQTQTNYLKEKGVLITKIYEYANQAYLNNISFSKGIAVKYIVDSSNRNIYICGKDGIRVEIPFSEIIGCEVLSDSKVVGGIKRAIVGGMLAGDTGALIGTMTAQPHIMSYKIVIYRSNIQEPTTEIALINEKTSTKNSDYVEAVDFAQKVLASIKAIVYISSNR